MKKRTPHTFFKEATIHSFDTFFSEISIVKKVSEADADEFVPLDGIGMKNKEGESLHLVAKPQAEVVAAWNELAEGVFGTSFKDVDAPMGHFEISRRVDQTWGIKFVAPTIGKTPPWGGVTSSWVIGVVTGSDFSEQMKEALSLHEGASINPTQLEYQFPELVAK